MKAARPLTMLHTARSNVALFDRAARAAGFNGAVRHVVRADLLRRARRDGGLTPALAADVAAAVTAFLERGEAVLCTCSTLGPVADALQAEGAPVGRVDRALAQAAFAAGDTIAVLVAVATTREPTRRLFAEVAEQAGGKSFEMVVVEGAWALFESGDLAGYNRMVADAVRGLPNRFDAVALAQSSMAEVALLEPWSVPVLTSPACAFAALPAMFAKI